MNYNYELKNLSVLVVGDVMLDEYLEGSVQRISPEAPVPVVSTKNHSYRLGGAANVALGISRLGVNTSIIGVIGKDQEGRRLAKLIKENKIGNHLVFVNRYRTTLKKRVISGAQQLLRIDSEERINKTALTEVNDLFKSIVINYDTVVFSDYDKGLLENISGLIKIAKSKKKFVIVDPKSDEWKKYRNTDLITPNKVEFINAAVKNNLKRAEVTKKISNRLMEKYNIASIAVTMSEQGIVLFQKGRKEIYSEAITKNVYDVTGAGDTVVCIFAAFSSIIFDKRKLLKLANVAAGITVGKIGSYALSLTDIEENFVNIDNKSILFDRVNKKDRVIQDNKNRGIVVFTNGCFDIVHSGHLRYLEGSRRLGDYLIVGLNSDSSIKRLKGKNRPINKEKDRFFLLKSLKFVDEVIIFEEDTPLNLIRMIKPNIITKGGDYKKKEIVGSAEVQKYGGKVKILKKIRGFSSTNIIEKIKKI